MEDAIAAHVSTHTVLRVTAGLHHGAQIRLRQSSLLLLGCADDCDVILIDSGVAPRHAAVTLNEGGIAVRALERSLSLDERDVAPGESLTWPDGATLKLGTASVVLGSEPEVLSETTESATLERAQQVSSARHSSTRKRAFTKIVAACAVVGVGAVFATALAPLSTVEPANDIPDQKIAGLLTRLGLEKQIHWSSEQGVLSLTGITRDEASYAALVRELTTLGLRPHLQVTSRERAASNVKEVFRVNGLDVDAQFAESDVVLVRGLSASKQEIDRIVKHALKDVPGLKEIRIADGSETTMLAEASMPIDRVAKRVVSIVNGSPAYVVTADGSRYFLGALLPQGQRVVAIDGSSVTLEREGKQLIMNF
jgi:type III secretion protein D